MNAVEIRYLNDILYLYIYCRVPLRVKLAKMKRSALFVFGW